MISPEVLRRFAFFTTGGEDALRAVATFATEARKAEGEFFFHEGDVPDAFYVLLSGSVDIIQILGDGEEVILDTIVAGDMMGWSAVAGHAARGAHAKVAQDTTVVRIDAAGLRALILENDAFGRQMMTQVVHVLSRRLGAAWARLAAM